MNSLFTIVNAAEKLRNLETTSAELIQSIVNQVEEYNPAWKIFAGVFKESAILAATQSDERRANNQTLGVLDGVPIAVKDNFHIQGYPVAAGTGHDFSPRFDHTASVVQRLQSAGAVIIGSCTMDEAALGATTNNPHTGQCFNPARPGCTPGGSSGGSAAAVAANWATAAIGTDTLGSVRIPSAYCHLWGIKPTHASVPTDGLVPLSPDFDSAGPIARNAEDLKIMLAVIANHRSVGDQCRQFSHNLSVGVPSDALLAICEADVAQGFEAFLNQIIDDSVTVVRECFEFWNPGQLRRDGLIVTEVQASQSLESELADAPAAFSDSFHAMMQYGRSVTADRFKLSVERIKVVREKTLALLDKYDYLLLPTAPQTAFTTDKKAPDNQADFTALASVTECPAVAFPIPVPASTAQSRSNNATDRGEFASAQLLGKPGSDFDLITVAERLMLRQQ